MNQKAGVVNIRGKEYKTVALRVQEFHEQTDNLFIQTEIVLNTDVLVVMKASIVDIQGHVHATGHAEEFRGSSNINRTSALENAETSAIGRALASFGLGGQEFASANEVQGAIAQQGKLAAPEKIAAIQAWLENGTLQPHMLEQRFGHCNLPQLLDVEADRVINGVNQSIKENSNA